jgi:hypothetical protein
MSKQREERGRVDISINNDDMINKNYLKQEEFAPLPIFA